MIKLFKITCCFLSLAIIANGSAMAFIHSNHGKSNVDSANAGEASELIFICTANGYKSVNIKDYFNGKYQNGEGEELIQERHCPMCNISVAKFNSRLNLESYIVYDLSNDDLFKESLNNNLKQDQLANISISSRAPPKLS